MCLLSAIGLVLCPSSSYNGTNDFQFASSSNVSVAALDMDATVSISQTIQHNFTIRTPASGGTSAISLVSLVNESLINASDELVRQTLANALTFSNASTPLESFEQSHRPYALTRNSRSSFGSSLDDNLGCVHREYIVFTWVLCLVSLATALKLYYLIKAIMALAMVAFYTTLIFIRFSTEESFSLVNLRKNGMPLGVQMLILLITFLIMVCYHARLVEVSTCRYHQNEAAPYNARCRTQVTSRLDFIWKEQAERELTNMKSNRALNDTLIKVQFHLP